MTQSGKHCGKRRNCTFCAISSFVTMFSKRHEPCSASTSTLVASSIATGAVNQGIVSCVSQALPTFFPTSGKCHFDRCHSSYTNALIVYMEKQTVVLKDVCGTVVKSQTSLAGVMWLKIVLNKVKKQLINCHKYFRVGFLRASLKYMSRSMRKPHYGLCVMYRARSVHAG